MAGDFSFPVRQSGPSQLDVNQLVRIELERERRQTEALRLYEPQPFQQLFHGLKNKEVLLKKANQTGGPQPEGSKVLTPFGWETIESLRVGDFVIGGDGKPCRVLAVIDQGWLDVYELTFHDGAKTRCSEEHHWKCKSVLGGDWEVRSLRQIMDRECDTVIPMLPPSDSVRLLTSVRPVGNAKCWCITVDSPDHTYVTDDYVVTHNSLALFVELARAVTGQDPYNKYPKENGIAAVLGFGEKHIGRVIHKYLFRAGAFQMIKDLETGLWRTFRPWAADVKVDGKAGDAHRKEEAKPVPPLVPERYIEDIAWEKKNERIFSLARFKNGWELHALNSAGDPSQAQGFQLDLLCIDEDLANSGWLEEMLGRLSMRKGIVRWAAVPHAKTEDMMTMLQRAEDDEEAGKPIAERSTIRIGATIYDNAYMPEETKKLNETIWRSQGEEVYRKRALAEIVLDAVKMYPTFSRYAHDVARMDEQEAVRQAFEKNSWNPPGDWCLYMSVDPGHTVCAVEFVAVAPPHFGLNVKVVYDECYILGADKNKYGSAVKEKIRDKVIQDFIIDAHGGKLREIGSGIHPKRQYEDVMEQLGIRCVARGARFMHGSDDIKGREEKLRELLAFKGDGYASLYFIVHKVPNLVRELERFKKKTVKIGDHDVPTDDGNRRANTHAVEALEYLAAHGMPYIKPPYRPISKSFVDRVLESRKKREQQWAATHGSPGRGYRVLGPQGA